MSDMIDLLPCPFCGDCRQAVASGWLRGYAEEMHTDKDVWGWSVRHHCGSQGPEHPTEAEAIAAWNTRAALPPAPDAVEALYRAVVTEMESCEADGELSASCISRVQRVMNPFAVKAVAQPDAVEALVAEAVAQERERCAKVAEDRWEAHRESADKTFELDYEGARQDAIIKGAYSDEARAIAAAIRAGGKP